MVNNANKSSFVRADIFHVNNEGNIVIDATRQPFTIGCKELLFDEDGRHPDEDEVMLKEVQPAATRSRFPHGFW